MKVDLNFKIKKLDGTDFVEQEQTGVDSKGAPIIKKHVVTLRYACATALTSSYQEDQGAQPIEKAKRGWLAQKIFNHPEPAMDLSIDEIKQCKDLIAKRFNPLIIAQAWEVLDPASKT